MRSGGLRTGVLLGVLALAACSSGDAEGGEVTAPPSAPATSETLTAEPTGEPTDSGEALAPPEMPAEAREQTAEGAAAFATYWFDTVEYAYGSGDTEPFMAVSLDECSACNATEESISAVHSSGARWSGLQMTVSSAVAPPPDERGTIVSLLLSETESNVVNSDGSVREAIPAAPDRPFDVFLRPGDEGWMVYDVAAGEAGS